MPYEHDAPPVYEEPKRRPPTPFRPSLPGMAVTAVLLLVLYATGVAQGASGVPWILATGLAGDVAAWLWRRRRR